MTSRDRFALRATNTGIELEEDRLEALWSYFELLMKWNRRVNLTGFSFQDDTDAAIDRLLVEPLIAARIAGAARLILDVGSGSGSPAIPFALGLRSATELVLVESRTRKAVFLREALRATGIPGRVVLDRFERFEPPEPFDVITVRAVAPDHHLWALVGRALGPQGRLFWFHSASQPQPQQAVVTWGPPIHLMDGDSRVSVGAVTPAIQQGSARRASAR